MNFTPSLLLRAVLASAIPLLFLSPSARAQGSVSPPTDLASLAATVRQLQSQVESLNSRVAQLQAEQQESRQETAALHAELDRARHEAHFAEPSVPQTASAESVDTRLSHIEEDQALLNGKINEQSQTKIESASKYRVRLSGIVLLNTAATSGGVDNLDIPQFAQSSLYPGTSNSFSGSLRQSQIGLDAFGPEIAGARTSANIRFDFAGGFPQSPNGTSFGIVRLRTGTIRFDWSDTSLIAGQDTLFFSPLTPTTLSSLAIPALSYSGNLWSWTPQVRVEHRLTLSETSHLLLQAGILDSTTGDIADNNSRYPSAGELSGPAYATRVAWTDRLFGRDLTLGIAGAYQRQNWGYHRNVDGWVGVTDATLPLTSFLDFTAEFYRGRAVGGFGGGIGQSILLSGPINNYATQISGLDSLGGWLQLKIKPAAKFEVNLAYGQDNPYAGELRSHPGSSYYYGYSFSRNRSPFANIIYRFRSDVLFSLQYQRFQTDTLDAGSNSANQVTMSLGYLF